LAAIIVMRHEIDGDAFTVDEVGRVVDVFENTGAGDERVREIAVNGLGPGG